MKKITGRLFEHLNKKLENNKKGWVKVGMSTCGIAAGAESVYEVLIKEVQRRELDIEIKKTGCLGACYVEPLVEVCVEGVPCVVYGNVDEKAALGIVDKHICAKRVMNDHVIIR